MTAGLVLFDIDGTLLRKAGAHHREALIEAVRRATGLRATLDGIPVSGMLDRDIAAAMLRAAGAKEAAIRRAMPQIVIEAQKIYVRTCPDLKHAVCPGARDCSTNWRCSEEWRRAGDRQPDAHWMDEDGTRGTAPLFSAGCLRGTGARSRRARTPGDRRGAAEWMDRSHEPHRADRRSSQ